MTRKHFVMIANILKIALQEQEEGTASYNAISNLCYSFADYCSSESTQFKKAKFLLACGVVDFIDCWCNKENLVMPHDAHAHYKGEKIKK